MNESREPPPYGLLTHPQGMPQNTRYDNDRVIDIHGAAGEQNMNASREPPPYGVSTHPQGMPQPQLRQPHQMPQTYIMAPPRMVTTRYGPEPQPCICPFCHANIKTRVKTEATSKTHGIALLLCLCLCWPCVCVPYCMDSCQNRNHYCPNCQAFLGKYGS